MHRPWPLLRFLLRRLAGTAAAILGAALLVFFLRHLVPGDPVDAMLGEQASPADRALLAHCLDLDLPMAGQLAAFARDIASGTLGVSCKDRHVTVASRIAAVFPHTAALALAAMALALVFGVPLGVLAAGRPGSWIDRAVNGGAVLGLAMPALWLGPLLLYVFYVRLGWLPGPADPPSTPGALWLPAITLALHLAAVLARMTRGSLIEIAAQDFIRTAYAKGLPRFQILYRHALPNALLPVITVAGLQLGALLAGAVVTEKIFSRPGLGTLLIDSLSFRDWKTVQGVVLVIAVSYVVVNLVVDLLYHVLDPRLGAGDSR